ncbi:SET domain-containing protein [Abortiporus biennis]|nr:SET domain-containing protein [Abortiporus biennis]
MSFASLHAARKSKEIKSFVRPNAAEVDDYSRSEHLDTPTERVGSTFEETMASTAPATGIAQNVAKYVALNGLHSSLPSTLEIREDDNSGRGMYAKHLISTGSILVSLRPTIFTLSTGSLHSHCSSCAALSQPPAELKRCTRCKVIWYCNANCQNNDWALHKFECSALQKWAKEAPSRGLAIPSDAVRCIGRMLWMAQKEGLDSIFTRELSMMQSHKTSLPPTSFESHTFIAHSLVRYLGVSSPVELQVYGLSSAGDLVDLISRFTTNTFTLTTPSLSPIGVCVSPTLALANHSCNPNAVFVFPRTPNTPASQEPQMQLVAIKDIQPDEEIFVSYIDTTMPRELRRKELKETYNFDCACTLCANPPKVDPRQSMRCTKACGGVCPIPTQDDDIVRCTTCKSILQSNDAILDAVRLGQEALDKAASLRFSDLAKAKQLTTNMIPIMSSSGLTPSSHPLFAMTHLHQEILVDSLSSEITQDVLDEAIRTATKYNAGLTTLLSYGHPVRGIAFAELGKLLAVDEPSPRDLDRNQSTSTVGGGSSSLSTSTVYPPSGPARLTLALEALIRARDELMIGFGKGNGGGSIGKEVREVIARIEGELGAWKMGVNNVIEDTRAGRGRGRN